MKTWDVTITLRGKRSETTRASGETRTEAARIIFERYPDARFIDVYSPGELHPLRFTRRDI